MTSRQGAVRFAWLIGLDRHSPVRYAAWMLCTTGFLLSAFAWVAARQGAWPAMLFLSLAALGLRDARRTRYAVLGNYPVIGHLRFLLEFVRPELRQYFIEGGNEDAPFSRQQRSLVFQCAQGASDQRPFGAQDDVGRFSAERFAANAC
jgi:hypothetical protein